MRKLALGFGLLGIVAWLVGCSALAPSASQTARGVADMAPAAAPTVMEQPAVPAAAAPAEGASSGNASASPYAMQPVASDVAAADTQRMVIHTDDLSLTVTDAGTALQSISSLAIGMGGYVASSNAWRENDQLRAKLTIRVPADKMNGALDSIKKMAVRVDSENITGQDVTEEYTDLNAQLTNLETTETELRQLMDDVRQKTENADDVLSIYHELVQTRGEIDRIKGRQQYLSQLTALATLNIELVPDALAEPVVQPGWRPLQTVKDAGRQLVAAMQGLANAAIWLIVFVVPVVLAIGIPIALLVLLVRWLIRRGRRGGKQPAGNAAT